MISQRQRDRFSERYIPVPECGCWIWTSAVNGNGYGMISSRKLGRMVCAHRVSYEIYNGPIPPDKLVLHHCDTPACVNPDHLVLGTHKENSDQMSLRGRSPRGSRSGTAILNEEDISFIRSSPMKRKEVAAKYGVSLQTISAVRTGQNWAWLNPERGQ